MHVEATFCNRPTISSHQYSVVKLYVICLIDYSYFVLVNIFIYSVPITKLFFSTEHLFSISAEHSDTGVLVTNGSVNAALCL